MKKVLSGLLVLIMAGTLTVSAFAAAGDITAEEVKINDGTEILTETLKTDAFDEDGMLRISPSTLLKIKLKLEGDETEGKKISFLANQLLENDEKLSGDKIQFIDEKTVAEDGTVSIQFRPRVGSTVGIYNMRAHTRNAQMFSKFYKTVSDQIQPSLTNPSDTPKKKDIAITVSGYTEAWKNVTKLYDVKDTTETEISAADYSFETSEETPQIATLKIKTTSDWGLQGQHTFRFKSSDIAYNPITFTANITSPEKVTSSITSKFVSANKPDGATGGTTTLPQTATEGDTVSFTVTAPNGYTAASAAYNTADGESGSITAEGDIYSFTMPNKAVEVTITLEPIEYTINFNVNGGIGNFDTVNGTVENLPVLPAAEPKKEGNSFVGWFVPTENGGRRRITQEIINNSFSTMLDLFDETHMLTLTANYTKNGRYEVIYQAPYAENKPTVGNYDAVESPTVTISEQEPTRTGYTFKGWKVEGDDTIYKTDGVNTYTVPKNTVSVVFVAQWDIITYTITLHDEADTQIKGTIESLPELTTPTKAGYDFKGWYTAETDGEKVEAITAANVTDLNGTTLYARWEEIQTDDYKIVSVNTTDSTINVLKRTNENAYLIVATYTANGNLVKATIKDISDIQTNALGTDIAVPNAFDGEYAKAKVFMWNSLDKMQPRCPAFPINKK